jgi:hypothetical protein
MSDDPGERVFVFDGAIVMGAGGCKTARQAQLNVRFGPECDRIFELPRNDAMCENQTWRLFATCGQG